MHKDTHTHLTHTHKETHSHLTHTHTRTHTTCLTVFDLSSTAAPTGHLFIIHTDPAALQRVDCSHSPVFLTCTHTDFLNPHSMRYVCVHTCISHRNDSHTQTFMLDKTWTCSFFRCTLCMHIRTHPPHWLRWFMSVRLRFAWFILLKLHCAPEGLDSPLHSLHGGLLVTEERKKGCAWACAFAWSWRFVSVHTVAV